MIKRILIFICTFLIAISGFLTGFFSVGCMSVYAAVNDDSIYVPLRSENDAVKAFQAYCKSRDLTIEGSLTDAVTTFTTGAFNSACNEIGIDITELQAELKAEYDASGEPVKFLFNDTGVMAMNRIFAQFLQDNELDIGDTDINKNVHSGRYFIDDQGNGCFVYINDTSHVSVGNSIVPSELGTVYIHDSNFFESNTSTSSETYSFHNYQYTFNYKYDSTDVYKLTAMSTDNRPGTYLNMYYYRYSDHSTDKANMAVIYCSNDSSLWVGRYSFMSNSSSTSKCSLMKKIIISNDEQVQNVVPITNIFIISNEINNNTYEGDTIINNDGDIINNPQPTQPNDPNDTIHNVPETPLSPNDDGGWDIDLPDIDIPNLPIGNLSEKFPFSIPWDLVAFYAMLDAEPEAPRFNGTMDLTLVQWNYDIDLSPFDSAAELCRKLQFGLFVVGLIVASRSIIRG